MRLAGLIDSFCTGGKRGFLAASHLGLAVLLAEAGCQWLAGFAQVAMTTRLTVAGLISAAPQASEGPSHTTSCGKAQTLFDEMCSRTLITTYSYERRPVCRVGPCIYGWPRGLLQHSRTNCVTLQVIDEHERKDIQYDKNRTTAKGKGRHAEQGVQPCVIQSRLLVKAQALLHSGSTAKLHRHRWAFWQKRLRSERSRL